MIETKDQRKHLYKRCLLFFVFSRQPHRGRILDFVCHSMFYLYCCIAFRCNGHFVIYCMYIRMHECRTTFPYSILQLQLPISDIFFHSHSDALLYIRMQHTSPSGHTPLGSIKPRQSCTWVHSPPRSLQVSLLLGTVEGKALLNG